jgi:hypothetical protein
MLAWILIPLGIALIVYSEKVVNTIGELSFAEKWFGNGGTYTFIKLFGLGMTILAFMWVTGGIQPLLKSSLGIFFTG